MPNGLMLFAAGFGTRMGALTEHQPKPLIEVDGRALIDHALGIVDGAGVKQTVVNAHYRAPQLAAHLHGRRALHVSVEAPDILDTGGGLKHALPLIATDPVYTLNSDSVWTGPNPLTTLRAHWTPETMDALLLLVPLQRTWGRKGGGDFRQDPDGRLIRGGDMVYTGAQILKTGRVAAHPGSRFSLNAIWDEIGADGRLYGAIHPGTWADVGHPDGIAEAETMLRAHQT